MLDAEGQAGLVPQQGIAPLAPWTKPLSLTAEVGETSRIFQCLEWTGGTQAGPALTHLPEQLAGWSHRRFSFSPLCPQGKVTLPNGFTLDGSFSRGTDEALCVQGVLNSAAHPPDSSSPHKR